MNAPLVSVICVCYNHERFVKEALMSVISQSYPNVEIIVVDDYSTDKSRTLIEEFVSQYPLIKFLPLSENIGNCAAFNRGFGLSNGEFIVDFSTDDLFHRDRIARQVARFSRLPEQYGVVYTDVDYIDEDGGFLYRHFEYLFKNGLLLSVPTGDVYADLLQTYVVSAPSMLVKRIVFEELKGYDETLAYEDFDFWVRSSRNFHYSYLEESLTKVRKTSSSLARRLYNIGDRQLHSTYLVCRKAQLLNRSEKEHAALVTRVRYELRHSVMTENYAEAQLFMELLKELVKPDQLDRFWEIVLRFRLPLSGLRRLYHRIRYS